MSEELKSLAISSFLDFYRADLETEIITESTVVMSFPVHFSGFHRVEVTITQIRSDHFILSDGGRTIGELRSAGYSVTSRLRDRVQYVSRFAKVRVVRDYLIAESDAKSLGSSIQHFVDAVKTVGDAYLVQRVTTSRDRSLVKRSAVFLRWNRSRINIAIYLRALLRSTQ